MTTRRARPLDALLAAVATLAATLPVLPLFSPTAAWFRPTLVLVAVVALVGTAVRALTPVRPVVVAAQLLALLEAAALVHGQGHLWRGILPTPDTGQAFGNLLRSAYDTAIAYTAPAPANRGVVLAVSLLVGVTAVAVDALAVTYRSPAAAGIPLLAAFLGAATNSGDTLSAWYVVPPAVAWLAMVGRQGTRSMRAWGAASRRSSTTSGDPVASYATIARVAGVVALAAAVVVPGLVPHFPTTFLAEGLGRSDSGRGAGGSAVRLSSSIDIARDLGSRSTDAVIEYTTTDSSPPPLRVAVLDTYRDGRWTSASDFTYVPLDGRLPGPSADASVRRTTERIDVRTNSVGLPQVALPENAVGSPFPEWTWHVTTPSRVAELTAVVPQYATEYVNLSPADSDFGGTLPENAPERDDLSVDPRAQSTLRAILANLVRPADSPIEVARAIQEYLRGPDFEYSEALAQDAVSGRAPEEPLVRFLQTKRGYCVQFASAMIMLSREAGIPARMAVGFLPGSLTDGVRTVRVSDAHAWPELYFPRLGWMRFEPTPGVRSGGAPVYSIPPTTADGASAAPTPTSAASPSASSATRPEQDVPAGAPDSGAATSSGGVLRFLTTNAVTLLVVVLVLLGLLVVPGAAWLARRRARRRARDDAERVEAEWQSLVLRLGDIGIVASDGATPRQAEQQLGRAAYLTSDEGAALGRVVSTLERARYAPPGGPVEDVGEDAHTVWRAALSRRRRLDQARALLLPEEGLRWWRGLLHRRPRRSASPEDDDRPS